MITLSVDPQACLARAHSLFTDWTEQPRSPAGFTEALTYPLKTSGKWLRPRLMLAQAADLDHPWHEAEVEGLVHAAAALEMIHTYSLVHDDLPAMDNDVLRRGLPTVHARFGEATAILVGDALLAGAFEVVTGAPHPHLGAVVGCLARAAGPSGMVGGQFLDIDSRREAPPNNLAWETLYGAKTGALFAAALSIPSIVAGVSNETVWHEAGWELGLMYQMADDSEEVRHPGKSGDSSRKWIHSQDLAAFQRELQQRLSRWSAVHTPQTTTAVARVVAVMFKFLRAD